jgi:TPR repeat protein
MPRGKSVTASRTPSVSGDDLKNVRIISDSVHYPGVKPENSMNHVIFEIGSGKMAGQRSRSYSMSELDMNLASGIFAFEAKEFAKAFKFLSPLAETGNPLAQYRLAVMFQNGLGHVRNEMMALKWMRAAAEQGDALAQHGLGFMYMQGECVAKNEKTAAEWFRRAAEQGLAGSQMTLGMLYEQGLGVEKNETEARKWYEKAQQNS